MSTITIPKIRSSCDRCLDSKVKCSQSKPGCKRCLSQGLACVYSQYRRIGRPPKQSILLPEAVTVSRPKRPRMARGSTYPQASSTACPPAVLDGWVDGCDLSAGGMHGGVQDVFDAQNDTIDWNFGDLVDPSNTMLGEAWIDLDGFFPGRSMPSYQFQSKTQLSVTSDSWATRWPGECHWPDCAHPGLQAINCEHVLFHRSPGSVSDVEEVAGSSGNETTMFAFAPANSNVMNPELFDQWHMTCLRGCPFECQPRLAQQLAQLVQYRSNGQAWRLDTLAMLEKDAHQQRLATLRCNICCSEQLRPSTFTLMTRILEGVFALYEHKFREELQAMVDSKIMDRNPALHRDLAGTHAELILCKQTLRVMFEDHLHATLALEHELAGDGRECIESCRNALARLRVRVKSAMRLELVYGERIVTRWLMPSVA